MTIVFMPIDTQTVRRLQAQGSDSYGHAPERRTSDGDGVPCRHCLDFVPAGEEYLVLAHRPFAGLHAYAETGPVFLCARGCAPGGEASLPAFLDSSDYILRGYDTNERIVYGTGGVVPTGRIMERAAELVVRPDINFIHIRSASNNCFHCRVEQGQPATPRQ